MAPDGANNGDDKGQAQLLADLLEKRMRAAVKAGIADAMTDENADRFWTKGFEVAQRESRKRLRNAAGDLVIGGMRGLVKWGSMVFVMLAFAYYIGGGALFKAAWTALTKGSG